MAAWLIATRYCPCNGATYASLPLNPARLTLVFNVGRRGQISEVWPEVYLFLFVALHPFDRFFNAFYGAAFIFARRVTILFNHRILSV